MEQTTSYKYGYNDAVGTYQCRVIEGGCDGTKCYRTYSYWPVAELY